MYIAFPPGGSIDGFGRELQKELLKEIPDVTILNKPGADGVIASKEFLSNDFDNNKIFLLGSGTTIYYKLLKNNNPGYDPILNFDMIGPLSETVFAVTVSGDSPIKNFNELLKQAQTSTVNCGSGVAVSQFYIKYLNSKFNTNFVIIPYKGGTELVSALKGNHIQCAVDGYPIVFKNTNVKILSLTAQDLSGTTDIKPVDNDFKVSTVLAVALHEKMDLQVKNKVINVLLNLHKNKEFVENLNRKGHHIPPATVNYQFQMQKDYLKLEDFRLHHNIKKE
jgi:tripartite-type tricarboxylate transporter receptor subunit TctC